MRPVVIPFHEHVYMLVLGAEHSKRLLIEGKVKSERRIVGSVNGNIRNTKEGERKESSQAHSHTRIGGFSDSTHCHQSADAVDSRPGCRNEVCSKGIGGTTVLRRSALVAPNCLFAPRSWGNSWLASRNEVQFVEPSGNKLTRDGDLLIYDCSSRPGTGLSVVANRDHR